MFFCPITDRKQLKIIPEANLNAQAAQIYEKVKEKEKMSEDLKALEEIKEIGKKMENAIGEYFIELNLMIQLQISTGIYFNRK